MTITHHDIKLMQPERLSDNSDGGGSMTGRPVLDAEINNLFEDISRINRTYGNVSLRKAFLKVDTATSDLLLDSHAIISAQPNDPNVSSLLFTTDNFYDERAEARQRIEGFVVAGAKTGLRLRGNQNKGQRSIICYSGVSGVPAPSNGDTLMLQHGEDIGTRQFIKLTEVTETNEVFSYLRSDGQNTVVVNWPVRQWVMSISTKLERDYPNIDPHPYDEQLSNVYDTTPSVSAKYYGTTKLAEPINAGAASIKVNQMFAPIIPTASSESAVIDQRPGGVIDTFIPTSNPITMAVDARGGDIYLPTAILPGSVSLNVGGIAYSDKNERLERGDASTTGFERVAIDYAGGVITILEATKGLNNQSITYIPAGVKTQVPHTGSIAIKDNNRNLNYVLQLNAKPAKRTFELSYQYLNKWYTIRDDGTGNLIGDGGGVLNYATGSVAVTLKAQPDANSIIFYRWSDPDDFEADELGAFSGPAPTNLRLKHQNIIPGSLTIKWTQENKEKSATDLNGQITGDAAGKVAYSSGVIEIDALPDANKEWLLTYSYDPPQKLQNEPVSISKNTTRADVTLSLSKTNVKPGSLFFTLTKRQKKKVKRLFGDDWTRYREIPMSFEDDGNGKIKIINGDVVGSVNYATGKIMLTGSKIMNKTSKGRERWEQ